MNGKQGIGTNSPGASLDIRSDVAPQLIVGHKSVASVYMTLSHNGTIDMLGGNANYNWAIGGKTRVFISNAGLVGIGTVAPTAALEVRSDTNPQLIVGHSSVPSARVTIAHNGEINMPGGNANFTFEIASLPKMIITNGGLVGIATTSPIHTLDVAGNAGNNTGVWATLSDARLKTDIAPLTQSLDLVARLQGVSFRWKKPKPGQPTGALRGFIAQDVQKVVPEWVEDGTDGYKRLQMVGIDALLVESIKELKQKNDQLEKQVNELSAKVAALTLK